MVDVVLMNCPMVFSKGGPSVGDECTNPWLGILYLAAYLEKNGVSVKVYDPGAENLLLKEVIARLKKDQPKLVGLSSLTSGIKSAVEITKAIKTKLSKNVVVGIGGSHINVDQTFIKRHPCFDFSIAGDGEITLTKLVKQIKKGKKIKKKNYQGELVKDLDELPFPARHLINIYNYFPREKQGTKEKPTAAIVGSRGCPYLCAFCSRNPNWRTVRFRSAKNIVDEMEAVAPDYDGKFSFTDDAITLNRQIALDLCQEIIKRGCQFRWLGMTRANLVDDQLLAKMKKAGCEELFFGVESGNPRVRNDVIHKHLSDKEIAKGIKLCRKHNIRASVFLMLGFPSETKDELEDTVNFGLKFQPDFIGVHLTIPLPGSEVFEIAKKEKQISKDIIDRYARGELGEGFVENWPIYIPAGMTRKYLIKAKKRAYRKFYLSPDWIWRRIKLCVQDKDTLRHDLSLIKTGFYVLIHGRSKGAVA